MTSGVGSVLKLSDDVKCRLGKIDADAKQMVDRALCHAETMLTQDNDFILELNGDSFCYLSLNVILAIKYCADAGALVVFAFGIGGDGLGEHERAQKIAPAKVNRTKSRIRKASRGIMNSRVLSAVEKQTLFDALTVNVFGSDAWQLAGLSWAGVDDGWSRCVSHFDAAPVSSRGRAFSKGARQDGAGPARFAYCANLRNGSVPSVGAAGVDAILSW